MFLQPVYSLCISYEMVSLQLQVRCMKVGDPDIGGEAIFICDKM